MMGHLITGTILAVLLARFLFYVAGRLLEYYDDYVFGDQNGCQLPPKLPSRWPLGIDRLVKMWRANADGRLLASYTELAKNYEPGKTMYQRRLFGARQFHVLHPNNVEAILSLNFRDYGLGVRPAIVAPLIGNGIFTQEGAAWKHSRELLRKQFVRMQYKNLHIFDEHVGNLIARFPRHGGTVDLQPLFYDLTIDIATAFLFGRSVYNLKSGIGGQTVEEKEFAEAFDIARDGLTKRFLLLPFHFLYNPSSLRQACRKLHDFAERCIREAGIMVGEPCRDREDDNDPLWFARQVAQGSSSEADLRDQLLNVLLAGRDSTACSLAWTFRLLVRHPDVMARLRDEVSLVMDNAKIPSRQQIQRMKFLSCVIRESLRLYPALPLNNRQAISTTILPTGGGPDGRSPILVRKGDFIFFSSYVTSRLESVFGPDAEDFRPERWETGELGNPGWKYFPFIGGPRKCLGEDFAVMEISYTSVRLLQTFPVIKLPEGEVVEPVGTEKQKLTLVLAPADGCRVYVKSSRKTGGGPLELSDHDDDSDTHGWESDTTCVNIGA